MLLRKILEDMHYAAPRKMSALETLMTRCRKAVSASFRDCNV